MGLELPHIGTFYILAIIVSLFLGALTSYAFKAHNVSRPCITAPRRHSLWRS